MSSTPADGQAAAAPQETAVTAPKPATPQPKIMLQLGPGLSKEEFTPAWVWKESGLFPLTQPYQMHDHNGRKVRLSYSREMNTIFIDPLTNKPEAESSTHPTPMLPRPTTGVSALTVVGLSIKFCFSFPRLTTRDRPTTPQNPFSHGFSSRSTPAPGPDFPGLLVYDSSSDENNAVVMPISTIREESDCSDSNSSESDSSDSDEFVVCPASPEKFAAGGSFRSDSSSSKKRSWNEGSGQSRTPSPTPPAKRARTETQARDVDFEDLGITANRPNRASPTLGEGEFNPVVHETTAPVPTTSAYGASQAPPFMGSDNWVLPIPHGVSDNTLLEMEVVLAASLAVVRQWRFQFFQQNNPQNPQ
ncbi:hypothetical protein V8F33_004737 [Rhypophila sp. PSN 637]